MCYFLRTFSWAMYKVCRDKEVFWILQDWGNRGIREEEGVRFIGFLCSWDWRTFIYAFLVMWISQFCFQHQERYWFSSHWEEWRSLAPLNSSWIWALAIVIINCWLYLRRFWKIKSQIGFSQMVKTCLFLSLRIWNCSTKYISLNWVFMCNTTWVGRTGGKKQKL